MTVREKIALFPHSPGVYRYYDAEGKLFNIKKVLLFLSVVLFAFPCLAQTDIKFFSGKSFSEVKTICGTPLEEDITGVLYECPVLIYEDCKIFFPETSVDGQTVKLFSDFETNGARFSVLSDYIEGGVKVGDPFSRLQNMDFVHTPYGRNKSGNGLKANSIPCEIMTYPANYVVFGEEISTLYFSVENGIIRAFALICKDEEPYSGYDHSNKIW